MLRKVELSDLPVFFEQQQHEEANRMAAFVSRDPDDREAFDTHWARIMADVAVTVCTILYGQRIAGHVASFEMEGKREVTYWIGRKYWGQGVASAALAEFLAVERTRPIYGVAAADNHGSIRVLQKCGFCEVRRQRAFAKARQEDIEEVILELR